MCCYILFDQNNEKKKSLRNAESENEALLAREYQDPPTDPDHSSAGPSTPSNWMLAFMRCPLLNSNTSILVKHNKQLV